MGYEHWHYNHESTAENVLSLPAEEEQPAQGAVFQLYRATKTILYSSVIVWFSSANGQVQTLKSNKVSRAHPLEQPALPSGPVHVLCQEMGWKNNKGLLTPCT